MIFFTEPQHVEQHTHTELDCFTKKFPFSRNALNIVKDDLIVKVDELSGEVEILSEQLNTATQSKNKLIQKVADLEEELKKTKDLVKQQSKLRNSEN